VLRSIAKQPGEPTEEEKEGYGGKDLQKRKILSLVSSIILVPGISVSGIEVCDVGC